MYDREQDAISTEVEFAFWTCPGDAFTDAEASEYGADGLVRHVARCTAWDSGDVTGLCIDGAPAKLASLDADSQRVLRQMAEAAVKQHEAAWREDAEMARSEARSERW